MFGFFQIFKSGRFFFSKNYSSKTIYKKSLKNQYTVFNWQNVIKKREAYLREWGSPSGRVGMECLIFIDIIFSLIQKCYIYFYFIFSGCTIGLEYSLTASEQEDASVADLLSFARQVACGMVSCWVNGILNYSTIVIRLEPTTLYTERKIQLRSPDTYSDCRISAKYVVFPQTLI